MRKSVLGAMLVVFGVIGCGGGGHSGPLVRTLVPGVGFSIPAGVCTDVAGPYAIPTGATMDFDIYDTPVGINEDSMEVGVMSESALVAAGGCDFNQALIDQPIVGSYSSTESPPLAGGSYDFIVGCSNIIDDCLFTLTWTTTY